MKTHLLVAAAALLAQASSFNTHAAAPAKPIELSFSHHETTASYFRNHGLVPWMKRIEEATQGRVKIVEYPSQTLSKQAAAWQATITGVADMAWTASIFYPGQFPLTDVITLPFLPITSGETGSGVLYQLYAKFPEIQNEYRNVKMLTPHIAGPYFLQTVRKQVKTLEDLKGLKVRTIAGPPTAAMKLLGATPLLIPIPDIYLALQKGVLDGAGTTFNAALQWRYYELIKYYTYVPLYSGASFMIMNLNKWKSLPKDIQEQITSVTGMDAARRVGKAFRDEVEPSFRERLAKDGYSMTEYTLPKDEVNRWIDVGAKPVWETYIKQLEAKGLPAQKVLDETLRLLKQN